MSTVIDYRPGMPGEVRESVESLLARWAPIIPAWCHTLSVIWQDDDASGALNIRVHYEYRRATLTICPNFLTCPDKREIGVIHEFAHILLAPYVEAAEAIRDELSELSPAVKRWSGDQLRRGEESAVCDLAAVLLELGHGLDSARTVG